MPILLPQFQADERPDLASAPNRVSDGRDQKQVTRRDLFSAAREEAIYRGNLDAQQQRHREAYRKRIAALAPVTGGARGPMAGLRNPEDIWDENRQAARLQGNAYTIKRQRQVFAQTLDQLARTRKDLDPRLTAPIEDDVRAIGLGVSERLAELKDRRSVQSEGLLGQLDTEISALVGGFVGSLNDPTALPQFIGGVLSGGTSIVTTSVAKQVLVTGAREAAIGATLEAGVQGVRRSNEKALGQSYGAKEAAMAIGGAAAGGVVIGGAGELVGAGVRKLVTGRALPVSDPATIETAPPASAVPADAAPNGQRALPAPLARLIDVQDQNAPEAAPAPIVSPDGNVAPVVSPVADVPTPDDGVRPFGFVPPESDRLADWEKAFEDAGGVLPDEMRVALSKIEAEQASLAASRQAPEPYRVPDNDAVRAIEKAYMALEMGEPMPAPVLQRRFAPLPEGADPSMPLHPDEALPAAAMWRNTGELPALAAGDPVLLDQIEALGRLSNATFDQVQRGELSDDLGAVIGELAWNRPDTHQNLSAMLIEADVTDVAQARAMVADRLDDLVPDASGVLLGVRALPILPAVDLGKVRPFKLVDAQRRRPPNLPQSEDDFAVMSALEIARAKAEERAQAMLREAAALQRRKPGPDMIDGDWKLRVASMRATALRDLAILDKGGLPESAYQVLDDIVRIKAKVSAPVRRVDPIEPGGPAAVQQAKDAAAAGGLRELDVGPSLPKTQEAGTVRAAAPVAAIAQEASNTRTDYIDMVVDPDGLLGDADNPAVLTRGDAAKVAARDDFMIERFRGCIIT